MTQTPLPASVTILDLAQVTAVTGAEILECVQTTGGVANSRSVSLSQIGSSVIANLVGATSLPLVGQGLATAATFTTLPVSGGGSGTTSLTAFGALYGNGTSTLGITAAGTTNWVLTGNGSALPPTFQQVNLTTGATGVLSVPFGGTNTSILTAFGVVYGNGSSTIGITAAGTTAWPLVGNGTALAPTFQVLPFAGISSSALASQLQAESAISSSFLMTPLAVAQQRIANAHPFGRNIVGRNGGFEVVQRLGPNSGSTISIPASSASYTADGWFLNTGANQSSTFTRATGIVSGSQFAGQYQRVQTATGTTIMYVGFPLDTDELNKLKGNSVVVSLTAAAGSHWSPASGNFTASLLVGTGAGGPAKRGATAYTGEITIIGTTMALASTNATARFVTAPSSAISTSITQAELQFSWLPVGAAGTSDLVVFDDVQVEVVPATITSQITPVFERSDFVWDLTRCKRFLAVFNSYTSTGQNIAFGSAISTSRAFFVIGLDVQARTAITGVTVNNQSAFQVSDGVTSAQTSTVIFNSSQQNQVSVVATFSTVITQFRPLALASINATAQMLFSGTEI